MWPCLLVSFCLEILIAESSAFYSSESLCCVCHSKIIITHNILFMGFSRQEYWIGLPFPSPVYHILSDLSTMTRVNWVAPHGMAWFHWVRKNLVPVIRLALCLWLWLQSVCPLKPPLSTYHLTWISLTLDMGYLFMASPAKYSWTDSLPTKKKEIKTKNQVYLSKW